jgi:flavin-binding protein dodecin
MPPVEARRGAQAARAPVLHQEVMMADHVYKLVELVGSSSVGTDEAIRNAVETAARTLRHIDWFQVIDTRGHVVDGKVVHYQVTLKLGFRLED